MPQKSRAAASLGTTAEAVQAKPKSLWTKRALVIGAVVAAAIVVVAGLVTAYIAMSKPDPVIDPDYYRHGLEINQRMSDSQKSLAPAVTGRNHAATPAQDHPTDR